MSARASALCGWRTNSTRNQQTRSSFCLNVMQVLRTCLLPPASQVPPSWGAGGLSPQWEIKAGRGWTYRDRDHGCPCGPSSQGGRASLRGGRCLSQGHELQLAREGFSGQGIACSTRNGHRRRGVTGRGLSLELHPCVQWKALMCTPKKQPEKSEQPRKPSPHPCISPGAADTPALLLPPAWKAHMSSS